MDDYKILVVDDDYIVIDSFKTCFEEYNVKTFIRPEQALEVIKTEPFHFIFFDIYMDPISGLDLCREARKTLCNKNAYIYAYTSETRQNVIAKFYDYDFDDIIEKTTHYTILKKKMFRDIKRETRFKIFNLYNSKIISRLVDLNEERDFSLNNIPLNLTKGEYKILKILAENKNRYLNSGDIHNILTGNFVNNSSQAVREHIMNIKNKFHALEPSTQYIDSRGEGYILKNC